jgi:hypothetical protein
MTRASLIVIICLLTGLTRTAVAQQQTLAPEKSKAPVEASLNIAGQAGGRSIQASGGGSCRHAPDTSLGGVSMSVWTVEYRGSGDGSVKQLRLELGRPKDGGPDQLSLRIKGNAGDHRIETGSGRKHKGEGTVTILPSGPGGRLELRGTDSKGKPVEISIDCPVFDEVQASGN